MRSATTRRMPSRGTVSRRVRPESAAGGSAPGAAGASGAAASAATAPSTSRSTIRPWGPVPVRRSRSSPCSRARRRARGEARTKPFSPPGAAGGGAVAVAVAVSVAAARTSASTIRPPGPLPCTAPRSIWSSEATRRAIGEARTSVRLARPRVRCSRQRGSAVRPGAGAAGGEAGAAGGRGAAGAGCARPGPSPPLPAPAYDGVDGRVRLVRGPDDRQQTDHRDDRPLLGHDAAQDAAGAGFDLGVDLVRLDRRHGVALLDGVPLLLQPGDDLRFGHGDAQLGHLDRGGHR